MNSYIPADSLFPTDRPVSLEAMIGRHGEATTLAGELCNGLNRFLAGPRRTGKTSLCRAAVSIAKTQGFYAAEVDLFEVVDLASLAERIIDGAIANRAGLARARRGVVRAGQKVASAVSLTAVAKVKADIGEELSFALETGWRRQNPLDALRRSIEVAQRLCVVDDNRLIVFIDEFQELAGPRHPFGDPDATTKALRSALSKADRITTLFAGSVEHMMRDHFNVTDRAFYRWGGWHSLEPIEEATWLAGLTGRYEMARFTLTPEAGTRLVALGEQHPRATMLLAKQAYLAAITAGSTLVTSVAVEEALGTALAADRPFHDGVVEDLRRSGRNVLDTAERIARGDPPYQDRKAASAAQRAIRDLEARGLLIKTAPTGRGGWRIADPLLRRYLAWR